MTAIILTYNEENILEKCLVELLKLTTDIIIVDSFSTDNTVRIAEKYNCKIFQKKFEGYASQRNYALTKVANEEEYIIMIDADEIITPLLLKEIKLALQQEKYDVLLVKRREFFLGKELKFSAGNGVYFPRIFRKKSMKICREINENYKWDGKILKLEHKLNHFSFNKGVTEWTMKHNTYSSMEAQLLHDQAPKVLWSIKRGNIKNIIYRSPIKLLILFIYYFILRLPFLDGRRGIYFSFLKFHYELLVRLKYLELKTNKKYLEKKIS